MNFKNFIIVFYFTISIVTLNVVIKFVFAKSNLGGFRGTPLTSDFVYHFDIQNLCLQHPKSQVILGCKTPQKKSKKSPKVRTAK